MLLSLFAGASRRRTALPGPVFFHHVPKTAGTSVIKAIRALIPRRLRSTEEGNLSAGYVQRLVERGLQPGQFIYGHPLTAAALPLRGRTRIATLLREPRDHVISNYLWLRLNREVPDHEAAMRLDLRAFLLARPYFAIFQTGSLYAGIGPAQLLRAEDLIGQVPAVTAYLEEMDLVGTVDGVAGFFAELTRLLGWDTPPRLRHRNRTRPAADLREALAEQFAAAQAEPALAPLFAAEQAVYDRARSLAG